MNYVNLETGEVRMNATYEECVTYAREDNANGFIYNPYVWVIEERFNELYRNNEINIK